jgi:hypothetical protein
MERSMKKILQIIPAQPGTVAVAVIDTQTQRLPIVCWALIESQDDRDFFGEPSPPTTGIEPMVLFKGYPVLLWNIRSLDISNTNIEISGS